MTEAAGASTDPPLSTSSSPAPGDVRPLSPTRRVVARKMAESARTIPAVTLHRSVLLAGLLDRRRRLAEATGASPSLDALIARGVAVALAEFDLLNSVFDEEALAVRVVAERHIAVAVDTDRGLTAVVLRAPDTLDDVEASAALAELVARARAGRSRIDDLTGATFTITNLGAFGIDAFSPIIVPPQVAILGIGRFDKGQPGAPATLSLSFDHRVVDGAYAARFLARLVEIMESPVARPEGPG